MRPAGRDSASPARSMSSSDGTPWRSMAHRSILRAVSASASGCNQSGVVPMAAMLEPLRVGLLYGDGLREIARLIDVQAAQASDLVRQELQRDHGQKRLQHPVRARDAD